MRPGLQAIRQTVRRLARNPLVTFPAVLSLALAVGANGAIFGVIKGLLLDPLPYAESSDVVRLWGQYPQAPDSRFSISYPNYEDLSAAPALSALTAYQGRSFTLAGDGRPARVSAVEATGTLFDVLGVDAALGRVFGPDEAGAAGERVAVLSHRVWTDRFGAADDVVGRTLSLDGAPYTVVGVMPAGFSFPLEEGELWVPLLEDASTWHRNRGGLTLVGRLAEGAGLDQLRSQLDVISGRIAEAYPGTYDAWSVSAVSLAEAQYGEELRLMLYTLLAAVLLLLVIAGINISNLLLARAATRRREVAVRAAMGAERGQVMQLFLGESVALGAAGGLLGLLVASAGIGVLRQVAPEGIARSDQLALDPWVMVTTLGLALVAGYLVGVLPATSALRGGPAAALQGGGRGHTTAAAGRRTQRGLVAAQVALALVVLTGAGLLLRTAGALRAVDPGFEADAALTASVSLTAEYDTQDELTGFLDRVLEELRSEPGVEAAGAVFNLPLASENNLTDIRVADSDRALEGFANESAVNYAGAGYFRALGIPLVEGRTFDTRDRPGSEPAIVLSETLARRFWPDQSAIGKRVAVPGEGEAGLVWRTVVGVVGSTLHGGLREQPRDEFYLPWTQIGDQRVSYARRYITLVARSSDPASHAGAVRDAVNAADPGQAVFGMRPMAEIVASGRALSRGLALLVAVFGAVALILAGVGVFGVISHAVAERRHEMGVRAALGAARGRILRQVFVQGLVPVAIGVGVGLAVAAAASDLLGSILYRVSPLDVVTFITVPAVLLAVAVAAVWIPAWRAARVEPVEALRLE